MALTLAYFKTEDSVVRAQIPRPPWAEVPGDSICVQGPCREGTRAEVLTARGSRCTLASLDPGVSPASPRDTESGSPSRSSGRGARMDLSPVASVQGSPGCRVSPPCPVCSGCQGASREASHPRGKEVPWGVSPGTQQTPVPAPVTCRQRSWLVAAWAQAVPGLSLLSGCPFRAT